MVIIKAVDKVKIAEEDYRKSIKDHADFKVIAEAQNGIEALECIERHSPSLVLLDIQMPRLDGISVASNLEFNKDIAIVFVTGFNEYAIKAFELNAVDYLLKPYDKERFAKTLNRFREFRGKAQHFDIPKLVQDYRADQHYPKTLLFKTEGTIEVAQAEDIQWIESSGNYIKVCLERTAFIARQTLIGAQSQLDPKCFVRIHRSHVININEVTQVIPIGKGDHTLRLKSGTELKLSRAYGEHFFGLFNQGK